MWGFNLKSCDPMSRILLAEDDDSLRGFLARALERAGHDVTACADGDEAVYHGLMFRGTRWDRVVVRYEQTGKQKMMKGMTLSESCRNAQEAFDLNAGLQQQLRRDYGWLDHNADDNSWMTWQGGEAQEGSNHYAFTLSTKKEGKTNIVSLALY